MFARAVDEHGKSVVAQKPSALVQRRHVSNSSTSPRQSSVTAFRSAQPQSQERTGRPWPQPRANHLRPAPEALLNGMMGAAPEAMSGSGAPSRTSRLSSVSDARNPFCDNGVVAAVIAKDDKVQGGVRPLQSAVYFDENDFDDDADLDLDVEDPSLKGSVTQPSQQMSPSRNPTVSHDADAGGHPAEGSSAPLPWSSSPAERRVAQERSLLPLPLAPTTPSAPPGPPLDVDPGHDANPRPKKRRNLPWMASDEGRAMDPTAAQGGPRAGPQAPRQSRRGSGSKDQYPWDKTASAVKEEQRRLRKSNKKLAASIDAREGSADVVGPVKRKAVGRVFLTDEQKHVANLVIEKGQSVFFTGSAGTGKSVLLREIIRGLQSKFSREPDRVAVTASTGLAACNIGGVTLHSFSGIGLGKEDATELVKKIKKNAKAKNRWQRTKVLIIDEISMVDGDLFDKLEQIARIIKNSGRAFGGIQLVITGDFFQLPPVPDNGRLARFAFEAATWSTSISHTIGLTQIFRQKDPVFAGMLNEMRLGKLTAASTETFRSLSRPIRYEDDLDATELFPTRAEVDYANSTRMKTLQGTDMMFEARDGGSITDKQMRDKLLSNCMAPPVLSLKKGAQVMLIKNLDESLVNGSLGKVVGFMDEAQLELLRQSEATEAFEAMESGHEEMAKLRKKLRAKADPDGLGGGAGRKWPYVRFSNADGTSRSILCQPESWKIELPNGEVQASRSQVPLILAWALSIHKAQGQTLERVKVDLGRVFEKGQAYVALSRATCREGLQVLRFDPSKVMAHEKVRQFYDTLYRQGVGRPGTSGADGSDLDDDEEEAFRQACG